MCKLISIKTGACPEDCSYCAQSSRYETDITPQTLLSKETVKEIAARAQASGVSRVCMGAAWRQVKDGPQFDKVVDMVREVTDMGMEARRTLGMLLPIRLSASKTPDSTPTITTWILPPSSTRPSSPPAPTLIA